MTTQTHIGAPSPWHAGEIALQETVRVVERMDELGRRILRDHLIEQHRTFYPQLPFVALGAVDDRGDVWATIRDGKPGFLHSPDVHHLGVGVGRDVGDPADEGMDEGDAVGLLGIELQTRRRNRLNGTIDRRREGGFDLAVGQSYGNCPQYIRLRDFTFVRDPGQPGGETPEWSDRLSDETREIVQKADTFFVASYVDREGDERQVDVSHRGGKTGFVRVDQDGALTIPDFAGNMFFNTLGNILVNGKAGLVFVGFDGGDLLQMTGDAEVVLDSPEIAAFQGAERLWRFKPRKVVLRRDAVALRWASREAGVSPNALLTGTWDDAAGRLDAAAKANEWRPFRVDRIVEESSTIRSIYLKPADDAGLVAYRAGQYLPIRITPRGARNAVIRTYTLSSAPSDGIYRISVKREGVASRHLHEALVQGDIIEARAPAGALAIDTAQKRPAVLLAAGVGITPLLAMLRQLVFEGVRTRSFRPAWLFYAARDKKERAFDAELQSLVAAAQGNVKLVRILSDTTEAEDGDFDRSGRLDVTILKEHLGFDDYDFYLCGPSGFMQSLYDGLRGVNVADERIHLEAFGPATVTRSSSTAAPEVDMGAPALSPVTVNFAASRKQARWEPGSGSLLEFAEAQGLAPEFSCRSGSCGSCRVRVPAGAVAYTRRRHA